eukprot:Nitzschia sp. Nitz4//scaffold321_size20361//633//1568//NITZ4_008680-RA/size20361-processed-gene-0.33-mRNA-1//-1//CDS//3329547766//4457//frame0
MTHILCPSDRDVLSGSGKRSDNHPGNKAYQVLVKKKVDDYVATRNRNAKKQICLGIVATIRKQNGRFLDKDATGNYFEDIGDQAAIEKVKQALRDADGLRKEKGQEDKAVEPMPPTPGNRTTSQHETTRVSKDNTKPLERGRVHPVYGVYEKEPLPSESTHSKASMATSPNTHSNDPSTMSIDTALNTISITTADIWIGDVFTHSSMASSSDSVSRLPTHLGATAAGQVDHGTDGGGQSGISALSNPSFSTNGSHVIKNCGHSSMSLEGSRLTHQSQSISGDVHNCSGLMKEPLHSDLISSESQIHTTNDG